MIKWVYNSIVGYQILYQREMHVTNIIKNLWCSGVQVNSGPARSPTLKWQCSQMYGITWITEADAGGFWTEIVNTEQDSGIIGLGIHYTHHPRAARMAWDTGCRWIPAFIDDPWRLGAARIAWSICGPDNQINSPVTIVEIWQRV